MDHPYWTCCRLQAMAPDLGTDLANALAQDEEELEGDNAFTLVDNIPPARSAGRRVTPNHPGGFGSINGESSSLGLPPRLVWPGGDFPGGGRS
jgi:hypothetical protein